MTTIDKAKRSTSYSAALKPIKLSSHDINVVSVIAQKTSLSHRILIDYAKSSKVSPDALKVITHILESHGNDRILKRGKPKKSSVMNAATDFSKWAAMLK